MDPVDNLALVALHASMSGGNRLVWAKDLERLSRRDTPDWDDLVRRARAAHIGPPVGLMLQRSVRLLGAQVPEGTVKLLVGTQPWTRLLVLWERLATPLSMARGRHTGVALMSSLRGTLMESTHALVRTVGRHVFSTLREAAAKAAGRRRKVEAPPANPLRQPVASASAREVYLIAINDHRKRTPARRWQRRPLL